jgi:hypothetical protein
MKPYDELALVSATVTTASRICPAAAMSSSRVAASAITWCDSGPWWTRARSRLREKPQWCRGVDGGHNE